MRRYGDLDYAEWTKTGFLIGVGLLAVGALGELLGHTFFGPIPAWEDTLFTTAEVVGILVGFFSIWIFGVILPLTE